MKKFLLNISFIAALATMAVSCVDPEPEYKDFPSKDVDFSYAVAPNANGEVEYALDYYVVSTIQFTNTSAKSGNVTWDFGDGTTSNEANPQHKYATAGTYQVKLTVEGVGTCTYPIMIYDISPMLSIKEQSAEVLTINDVSVDFDIFLPNPENKRVKYVWTFPDGAITENGDPITTFEGYADENGNVDYPGKIRFKNVGSQRITLQTTFDLDGENRRLEDSYVNVQVGADQPYKTLYYAAYEGNIKAYKLIPDGALPEGSKNLPFDMGVSSGVMPMTICYANIDGEGWIYMLDCGKQYTYINDENGVNGDGKINVMRVDGTGTNLFVSNVGKAAFDDPFFGCVDGDKLLYSDRNTGVRQLALNTRGATEANDYFVKNDMLGYYKRTTLDYGAISTTMLKDSKGVYWWGKCFNGLGIFRFKAEDIVPVYTDVAAGPYPVVLSNVNLRSFMIDEQRGKLYVYRSKDANTGFCEYPLPGDGDGTDLTTVATKSITMYADPINSTQDEGVYVPQMALDAETGFVYFGFNKAANDNSSYVTGLKYYNPQTQSIVEITDCPDKILGITINDNKTNLF